ncbi:MAG: DUF4118 domain-containing protein [Ilumatobacteraceae bacterium]
MRADRQSGDSLAVAAGGAIAAFGLAAVLVPLRDTLGPANVALLVTVVVVLSAVVGGRTAGALTGVVGAITFNFLYTKPYLTLRVSDSKDIATIVLIVVIGLGIGQLTSLRSRQRRAHTTGLRSLRGIEAIAALASAGAGTHELWDAIRTELIDSLQLTDARWEQGEPEPGRPTIDRDGHLDVSRHTFTGHGFALPDNGAQVPVVAGGRRVGQIVLEAPPLTTVTVEQRRAVIAMADQLAATRHAETTHHDTHSDTTARGR